MTWIGHNVDFDIRFLWQRLIVHSVDDVCGLRNILQSKPWEGDRIDTMQLWAGTKDRISLENLCLALGIPGKNGMDGSQVWDYVQAGRYEEVAAYCSADVERVREIWRRLT